MGVWIAEKLRPQDIKVKNFIHPKENKAKSKLVLQLLLRIGACMVIGLWDLEKIGEYMTIWTLQTLRKSLLLRKQHDSLHLALT